jgi:hypothetical protein
MISLLGRGSAALVLLLPPGGLFAQSTSACSVPDDRTAPVPALTAREKTTCYLKDSFSVGSAVGAFLPAAYQMAVPPRRYPRSWKDGAGAFGRNYGDGLATEEAAQLAKSLAATLVREDPRYFRSNHKNSLRRTTDAVLFAFVDRSDSGKRTLAFSNFAGASAAGFVGRSYLPAGYDDNVHALQRAAGGLAGYRFDMLVGYALSNILEEFKPDLLRLGRRFHLPTGSKATQHETAAGEECSQ